MIAAEGILERLNLHDPIDETAPGWHVVVREVGTGALAEVARRVAICLREDAWIPSAGSEAR